MDEVHLKLNELSKFFELLIKRKPFNMYKPDISNIEKRLAPFAIKVLTKIPQKLPRYIQERHFLFTLNNEELKELAHKSDFKLTKKDHKLLAMYGNEEQVEILMVSEKFNWLWFSKYVIKHYRMEFIPLVLRGTEFRIPRSYLVEFALESNNVIVFKELFPTLEEYNGLCDFEPQLSTKLLLDAAIQINPKAFEEISKDILLKSISYLEPESVERLLTNINYDSYLFSEFVNTLGTSSGMTFDFGERFKYFFVMETYKKENKIETSLIEEAAGYKLEEKFDILVKWLKSNKGTLPHFNEYSIWLAIHYTGKRSIINESIIRFHGFRHMNVARKLIEFYQKTAREPFFHYRFIVELHGHPNGSHEGDELLEIDYVKDYREILEKAGYKFTQEENTLYNEIFVNPFIKFSF